MRVLAWKKSDSRLLLPVRAGRGDSVGQLKSELKSEFRLNNRSEDKKFSVTNKPGIHGYFEVESGS